MLDCTVSTLPVAAARLLDYWHSSRTGDRPPDRSAVDPLKLRDWIGDISMIEVHEGEKTFYLKLHGMNVAKQIGDQYNRAYLEDRIPPAVQPLVLEPYRVSLRTERPVHSIIYPGALTGIFSVFERLILPFTDKPDGEVVLFLAWVAPTGRDELDCPSIYGDARPEADALPEAVRNAELHVLDDMPQPDIAN